MRRLLFITISVLVCFILEFSVFNLAGWWLRPQLLILLIIFFNLYLGVRYGLYTAVLAGLIMDSFAASVFGLNLVSFILVAYMTTFLRKYIYYRGSRLSRLILVFILLLIDFSCRLILHAMLGYFDPVGAIKFALLPGLTVTLLLTTYTFQQLRQCASKLLV